MKRFEVQFKNRGACRYIGPNWRTVFSSTEKFDARKELIERQKNGHLVNKYRLKVVNL